MLKNYFRIAFRNLWRSKGFSLLNIFGLAVGMASAILILMWIQNEVSFDRFHKNDATLYKAWNRGEFDGKLQYWDNTPRILGPTLRKEYPEIADVTRALSRWYVTTAGERKISTQALVVDPSFLSMFSFPLVKGNAASALSSVYSIVITESMARKMFGTEDAMNKTIKIDGDNFAVTGVLKDLPINTQFSFEYLLPYAYQVKTGQDENTWSNNALQTYIQLKPNVSETAANEKIKNISRRHSNGEVKEEIFLHPVSKWHLWTQFENGRAVGGLIGTVRLFGVIAAFILLIACINFMNLSTARSEKRAKEVGIRKVAGAGRGMLILQFLGESLLITLIAGVLALFLVQLTLPSFDLLVGKHLAVPYGSISFWIPAILFILVTGVTAGSYPAFFLSSFQPVTVLKGAFKKAHAAVNPRKILVVVQFSFAIILIICTIVVVQQTQYGQDRESGYDKGQLVYHWLTGDLNKNFPLIKSELLNSGIASSVTRTGFPLTDYYSDSWGFLWQGKAADDKTDFNRTSQDQGLVKTAGLKMILGRDMDLQNYPTDSNAMILNETAARAMGFKDPIGQIVTDGDQKYHVVGVIKDFIMDSPYDITRPTLIEGARSGFNVININLTAGNASRNVEKVAQIFRRYNPDYPFEYHFVDDDYARKFSSTKSTALLIGLFAGLTILISCLGLFGLAAYMAENRIKEIGVRKVLGASVFGITALLSKDFLFLVIISLLIASPIAWYAMHLWLEGYAYRIHIEWWVFALAGILSVAISLLTVSYQAIRAAIANPVRSLRSE